MTKFIKKLLIKIAILIILFTAVSAFLGAISTIMNNHIALGQLENSDEMFVVLELYNNFIKPTIFVVEYTITAIICFTIGVDVYNFLKTTIKRRKIKDECNKNY